MDKSVIRDILKELDIPSPYEDMVNQKNAEYEILEKYIPLYPKWGADGAHDPHGWLIEAIKLLKEIVYGVDHEPAWFMYRRRQIINQLQLSFPHFSQKVMLLNLLLTEVSKCCNVIELSIPSVSTHIEVGEGFDFSISTFNNKDYSQKVYDELGFDNLEITYQSSAKSALCKRIHYGFNDSLLFSIDEGLMLNNSIFMMIKDTPVYDGLSFLLGIKDEDTTISFYKYI